MDLLDRLLGHDEWTTALLLDSCAGLSEAQLDQTFDIDHGSIRALLVHMIRNIETWTDLMSDKPLRQRLGGNLSVDDLVARHAIVYRDFQALARTLTDTQRLDERWIDRVDDPPTSKTYGGAILHVITHNMHHRAHLLLMLGRLSVSGLPEGDLLGWEAQL